MIKAVIFDMDGVIIDSQPISDKLLFETAKKHGATLTMEEMKHLTGASGQDFWQYVKDTYKLPLSAKEYQAMYDVDAEIAAYNDLQPIDGIVNLLTDLYEHNILIGLATTAEEKRMNAVLDIFDLRHFFAVLTSINEVHNSKPDPEIYLLSAKKLRVEPNDCVVIEDSKRGLQAAKNAGMKCIWYTNSNEQLADLVISDFAKLDYNVISSL